MNEEVIEKVVEHAENGAQIFFGRNHTGGVKVKIKYGPLGLLTARYGLDRKSYEEIKERLRLLRVLN